MDVVLPGAGSPPRTWDADVVTADGGTVHIRPISPGDAERLVAFHGRQSAESIYFRFFSPRPRLSATEVEHLTNVDGHDRMAFVALVGDDLVGVARYDHMPGRADAEVAFFVDEEHKGRGLGTILLEYLAAAAREVGISAFTAVVLPTNRRMITVFQQAGFDVRSEFAAGVVEVRLDLEATPEALAAMEGRAQRADAQSVARLLAPSSIAVIGAGRDESGLGHQLLVQLLQHHFAGPVYPVNPHAGHVAGVRAYASVLDVPDRVDLAVIAVPQHEVRAVVEQCAAARVGGLVVTSGGFSETSDEGAAAESELVGFARGNGMRMIGPNSMGVINTEPDVRMHATFAPIDTIPGGAAVSAQAGALVAPILERANRVGLGISSAVAIGNKADVSGNDLLRYWSGDERTRVVLLYLESFGNPRRFSRLVRDVSRTKPVVCVTRAPGPMTDALLAQTGVIRVDTLEEMVDVARVLDKQPLMRGRRVAVLGNAGGPTTLASDACMAAGLELAALAPETLARLQPAELAGRTVNPIELTHHAAAADYDAALRTVLADDGVDAALVVYAPAVRSDVHALGAAVHAAATAQSTKPVVTSLFAVGADVGPIDTSERLPNFRFADAAARSLARAAEYGEWRLRPVGSVPPFGAELDATGAEAVAAAALAGAPEGTGLGIEACWVVVQAAGLALVPQRLVWTSSEVVAAAEAVGFPVALKATGLTHLPKTEAGGLALDLYDAEQVAQAYERMTLHLNESMVPAVVQQMATPGFDVRVRLVPDPVVGAAIGIGPGGAAGLGVPDQALRVMPLTDVDADDLVERALGAWNLGSAAMAHVVDAVLRLSWVADQVPALAEMSLDPVIVTDAHALVIDVAARVAPWRREQDPFVRRI